MKTQRRLFLLLSAILMSHAPKLQAAGAENPSAAQVLTTVRLPLTVQSGHFTGPGWQAVMAGVGSARFIAIGEDHLTQQVPQFVTALCDAIGPGKLAAMAFETGPEVAAFVQHNLHAPDHQQEMGELTARYPDSVAFLNIAQENNLATHCAEASGNPKLEIWGLDQEFFGAGGWLLDKILAEPLVPKARAVIRKLKSEEVADAANAKAGGDPSKLFLFQVDNADLATASTALTQGGTATSRRLMGEIEETHRIYKENADGLSQSNVDRAALLKHNLSEHLNALTASSASQKVLLKFGEWHLYRGYNPLHVRDLGNFLAETADQDGAASFHIAFLGARGVHASYAGYDKPLHEEPFVMSDDPDYTWLKSAIDAAEPIGWTVFDLRRLRGHTLKTLSIDWQRMVDGYDLFVLAPAITPARPIAH